MSKPKEPELVWRVLFFWFPAAGACLELESIFDHECVQCSKSKRPEREASESENGLNLLSSLTLFLNSLQVL